MEVGDGDEAGVASSAGGVADALGVESTGVEFANGVWAGSVDDGVPDGFGVLFDWGVVVSSPLVGTEVGAWASRPHATIMKAIANDAMNARTARFGCLMAGWRCISSPLPQPSDGSDCSWGCCLMIELLFQS
jgi:hypothetical protein